MKKKIELCSILNVRSGRCTEDCRFCAQSARYTTGAPEYASLSRATVLEQAVRLDSLGVTRLSLVASGYRADDAFLEEMAGLYGEISRRTSLKLCASFGTVTEEQARILKDAGVSRYHHNLETGREFYGKICGSHEYEVRLETCRNIRRAGLELCCGGILGMGETAEDLASFIRELAGLKPDAVPLNILTPVPGTPLAEQPPLAGNRIREITEQFVRNLPESCIRLAGGRQQLSREVQREVLEKGVRGLMTGDYLTVKGLAVEEDLRYLREWGYETGLLTPRQILSDMNS